MADDINEVESLDNGTTEESKRRYLIRYILAKGGVCDERDLMGAFEALEGNNYQSDRAEDTLKDHIANINVKLNILGYKVVHCMGRLGMRCYVYIDIGSSDETKLATKLKPDELTYLKWCLDKFLDSQKQLDTGNAPRTEVQVAVDSVLTEVTGQLDVRLPSAVTYTVGSTELSQFEELGPLESQQLLLKLCHLKWFYSTSQGRFGINVRGIQELKGYLKARYELPICCSCHEIVLEGVQCTCLVKSWHISCFRHYTTHVSMQCEGCGASITQGIYLT